MSLLLQTRMALIRSLGTYSPNNLHETSTNNAIQISATTPVDGLAESVQLFGELHPRDKITAIGMNPFLASRAIHQPFGLYQIADPSMFNSLYPVGTFLASPCT